jgi:hypothetical protein
MKILEKEASFDILGKRLGFRLTDGQCIIIPILEKEWAEISEIKDLFLEKVKITVFVEKI